MLFEHNTSSNAFGVPERSWTVRVSSGRGGWLTQCLVASAGAIALVGALLLIVPAMVFGVLVALTVGLRFGLRRLAQHWRQPNGMFDGRRNVRVLRPDDLGD